MVVTNRLTTNPIAPINTIPIAVILLVTISSFLDGRRVDLNSKRLLLTQYREKIDPLRAAIIILIQNRVLINFNIVIEFSFKKNRLS